MQCLLYFLSRADFIFIYNIYPILLLCRVILLFDFDGSALVSVDLL